MVSTQYVFDIGETSDNSRYGGNSNGWNAWNVNADGNVNYNNVDNEFGSRAELLKWMDMNAV